MHHQLGDHPPRRGGLPVLLGRVLRHGDAPAGPAGAGDPAVVSGESGAVGVGVLSAILHEEKLEDLRWSLGLNESSRVLCISTEGDTDQANYQKIVGERV